LRNRNFPTVAIIVLSLADTFTPEGNGNNCGYKCHTIVKAKDYIFHPYQKR